MNLKRLSGLADKAKQAFEEHGGTDRLKEDAERLKDIAKGPGSAKEKAKAAGDALRHRDEPGTAAPEATETDTAPASTPEPPASTPEPPAAA